jgi:hypothetical protein
MYFMFQFSRFAYSKICTKSGLQSFIVSDQLCNLRCLRTHTVRMKNSLTFPRQPEMGYLKHFLKRAGWLDHSKSVSNILFLFHMKLIYDILLSA